VDNCEQQLEIFLRKRLLDRKKELITVIQKETKRTEEKKEAGYTSPMWSILRALQKINKAKRLEAEAVMSESAPPFFQSAEEGDLKFWGEDDRPTVVVWESLLESEQEQWSTKMGKSNLKDWVVRCRSRKNDEEHCPFEVNGKEIFSNHSKQPNPKQERRRMRKEAKGSQCAGKRSGDRATSNAQ